MMSDQFFSLRGQHLEDQRKVETKISQPSFVEDHQDHLPALLLSRCFAERHRVQGCENSHRGVTLHLCLNNVTGRL